MNPENYYLKFTLEGVPEPVTYRVSRETGERVERVLTGLGEFELNAGLAFDTPAGRTVCVHPRHVLTCHVLRDVGRLPPEGEEENDLILYVRGRPKPFTSWDADLEELAVIGSAIEHGALELSAFLSFTDHDGAVLYVRSEQIMLMDSVDYSEVLEAEIAEYEAEAKETKAEGRRRAKRAPRPKAAPPL